MADLILPPGIRYECIRCGRCCRSLEVTLTEVEYDRLVAQDWSAAVPGYAPGGFFARIRRPRGKQVWRLRPHRGGACRFLTDEGLCQVHATLGLAAKPFAGRLFPFTFLPTPVGVFVSVRFNCPAVVRGIGPPLEEQRGDIQRLLGEYRRVYAPPSGPKRVRFFGRYELAWPDILRIESQLAAFLQTRDLDVPRRLLACRRLVRGFVGGAVRSEGDAEVGVSPDVVLACLRERRFESRRPSRIERAMMRLLVATFLGAALPSFRELSLPRRVAARLAGVARRLRLSVGRGRVRLPEVGVSVPIRKVASLDLTAVDETSAAMLERYFLAKIASQGFFGVSFFGRSFVEGLDVLASAYGVILWLAGAHALAAGRDGIEAADVEYGIRHVDYGFNYLGSFGGVLDRFRALFFWHWATPEKVLTALSRS